LLRTFNQSFFFIKSGFLVLASGSGDSTIALWRVADGSLLHILEGHADNVNCVAFSPDCKILSSGSNDNTIRLWQVADGSVLGTLEGHTSWVQSVAFTMGGIMLASWSGDGTIRLWGIP